MEPLGMLSPEVGGSTTAVSDRVRSNAGSPSTPGKPYVGMRPYEREERAWFYGRNQDARFLAEKILASRLTILYSLSGVGKSSLLRALVIPTLEESALVVRFEDWAQHDPTAALKEKLAGETITAQVLEGDGAPLTLLDIVELINHVDSRPIILVLDQFEEFLTNHEELDPLRKELAALVRSSRADVQVVLSLREEFLGALEPFRNEILNLFQSTYRLEPLDDRQINDVIRLPAEYFEGACDPHLVDALTQDLKPSEPPGAKGSVDLPMLQIVCEQLWNQAWKIGDRRLTLDLYQKLGRAQKVLEEWIAGAMPLDWNERVLTARMMLLLAPSSGLKMSFSPADLANALGLDRRQVETALKRLCESERRVLRPRSYSSGVVYELQHDALIKVVRPWRDDVLREADVIRQRAEAQKAFRTRAGAATAATVIVALMVVLFVLWRNGVQTAQTQTIQNLLNKSIRSLDSLPTDSVLFGVAAHQLALRSGTGGELAERSLREALAKIGGVPFRSGTEMSNVAVSGDARTVVATSGSTVSVWNVRNRFDRAMQLSPKSAQAFGALSLSDDGRWLAAADAASCVFVWRLEDRIQTAGGEQCVNAGGRVRALTFSPRGERLALGVEGVGVEVWTVQAGVSRARLPIPVTSRVEVFALAFTPDSQVVRAALGTPDDQRGRGRVLSWNVAGVAAAAQPHTIWQDDPTANYYRVMALGDNGNWLATIDLRGDLRVLDLNANGASVSLEGIPADPHFTNATFAAHGSRLALAKANDRSIGIWNVTARKQELALQGHEREAVALAFGGARWLAAVGADEGRLWDADDPTAEPRVFASSAISVNVVFWPDKPWAVVKDDEGAIRRLDLTQRGVSDLLLPAAPGADVTVQAVSGRGRWLTAGGSDGRLFLWEHPFAAESGRTDLRPFVRGARAVAFSGDERWLAVAADGVWLAHLDRRPFSERRLASDVKIESLAFSPDTRWLAAGTDSGRILLWPVSNDTPVRTAAPEPQSVGVELRGSDEQGRFTGLAGIVFDPESPRVAALYSNGVILMWAVDRPGEPMRIDVNRQIGIVRGFAFSPNGRQLAMGSANGVFVLNGFWTGNTQLTAIDNHPSEQVEWDRNGQRLAAGASDGTIHIWSLAAESPTDRIDLTHPGAILALRFSADGRRLGSVAEYQGRTQARVWTFETAELVRIGCGTVSRVSLPKNDCREAAKFVDCDICRNVPEK